MATLRIANLYSAADKAIYDQVKEANPSHSGGWMTLKPNGPVLGKTSPGAWMNFLEKIINAYEADPRVSPRKTKRVEHFQDFKSKTLITLRNEIVKQTKI